MSTPTHSYTCPYCRIPSEGGGATCPHCGAPVDVRERVSRSGWAEQPPIRDMARIHFNRSTCQIAGKYVPVAEMNLDPQDSVYFSHHVLLHADPNIKLDMMRMPGGWNRMLAGMPLIMMTAQGPGHVAISADHPGETIAVPLQHNQAIDVVEHRFLVATANVGYRWENSGIWYTTVNGDEQEWHYPLGQTMDLFSAQGGPGLLLLHAPGNTFIRDLQPGERILVQPGGLIWKDRSVRMSLHFEYPHGTYWFSSARWQAKGIWLTLHGPGRVAVQSVFEPPELAGGVMSSSGSTTQYW
ncbi:MAG TPA: AIM24 family protein [Streptosporangiaceae bacterium]|nr:AIM24 family protein [Streptosporangiaceae bacterium]